MIDPRMPRFNAAYTSVFALLGFSFYIYNMELVGISFMAYVAFMFIWSVFFKGIKHPYNVLYNNAIRKLLPEPKELEDARGPMFAQKIGLVVSLLAFLFGFISPLTAAIFAAILFVASALNAYLNVCIGCLLYLRLKRYGISL